MSILDYDPDTGVFTWRPRPREYFATRRAYSTWNARYAGAVSKSPDATGYLLISINKRRYKAHRLVWLYMTGRWPTSLIDHIDGDRANNRFSNLREATPSQNAANSRARSDNHTGIRGVTWHEMRGKWRARIRAFGKEKHLGLFDNIDDAAAAYERAALELRGEFARTAA